MCASSSGKRRWCAEEVALAPSGSRDATAATTRAPAVKTDRTRTVFCFMTGASRSLLASLLDAPVAERHRSGADEKRHQRDVEPLEARTQALDVLAQLVLHV